MMGAAVPFASSPLVLAAALALRPETLAPEALAALPRGTWHAALDMAWVERLLPLSWQRGGEVIRAHAYADVIGRWRTKALTEMTAAERSGRLAVSVAAMLRAAGVRPVLLRGAPLSLQLHGDPALRPSGDVDLFVDRAEWGAADEVLQRAGWTRSYGGPAGESAYRRSRGSREDALELHTSLSDAPMTAHLRLGAPERVTVELYGATVEVQSGILLAGQLALHAAKHTLPPLLWFADLHVLWTRLDPFEQAAAREAARRARIGRYLAWALERSDALARLAAGEVAAAKVLGYEEAGNIARRDQHNARRMVTLAATVPDAAAVLAAWAWPPDDRELTVRAARRMAGRLAKPFRGASTHVPTSDLSVRQERGSPRRALAAGAALPELVSEVVRQGASIWMRATGTSMRPAIHPGDRIRLVSPPDGVIERGTVVYARLPGGRAVVHRVLEDQGGQVLMRGDDTSRADEPTARTEVIAVADAVERDGTVVGIPGETHARPMRRAVARLTRVLREFGA